MHHILRLNRHQALHKLLEDEASLDLREIAIAILDESVHVTSVAELHHEVVVGLSLGASNQAHYVSVLDFSHYLDLIHQQLMVLALNPLPVNYLHCVVFIGVLTQVAIMD